MTKAVAATTVLATAKLPFNPKCTRCPRLAAHLGVMRDTHRDYHNAPVPPFGDPAARLLIVGLAPGTHGANATGRPFTGDYAGLLLYRSLFAVGLSNQAESESAADALRLTACRITNAVKCLPPANKPTTDEADRCNVYLATEIAGLPSHAVLLALGVVAHRAILKALGLKQSAWPFAHGALHTLPGSQRLVDSYHCSRYNTQTNRLTEPMFMAVLEKARALALD